MESILYVDDEESNLTVFEAAFEDYYDVHLASSGRQALELLRHRPFQVVITDMRMPGMDGIELLTSIIPDHPETVRLILTGYTDVESVIQAINEGKVYRYISKPWDERELRIIIDRACDHHAEITKQRRLLADVHDQIKNEEAIRTVFQRYVPRQIVEEVLWDLTPTEATRGELRRVTLLKSDIRGFTPICSRLEPRQVLELMNEYFGLMTQVILDHQGSVSQFYGDAVFATFGAPLATIDPERSAVAAALEMQTALVDFNARRARDIVGEDLDVGIAIHSGPVVVGNIGSPDKLDYTVIGDPVLLLDQIEAATKKHSNSIVISEDVAVALGPGFELTPEEEDALGPGGQHIRLQRLLGRKQGR